MTQSNRPQPTVPQGRAADRWRSRRFVPLVPVALGGVALIAEATAGHLVGGLAWFAILAAGGGLSAVAERFETARRGPRHHEEALEAKLRAGAMSITGTVLVIALTGCIAFTLARGDCTSPYAALLCVGGISYVIGLVALRHRS